MPRRCKKRRCGTDFLPQRRFLQRHGVARCHGAIFRNASPGLQNSACFRRASASGRPLPVSAYKEALVFFPMMPKGFLPMGWTGLFTCDDAHNYNYSASYPEQFGKTIYISPEFSDARASTAVTLGAWISCSHVAKNGAVAANKCHSADKRNVCAWLTATAPLFPTCLRGRGAP